MNSNTYKNGSPKTEALDIRPDWLYEQAGARQHYTIQAWKEGRMIGRAHGWFEQASDFVIEKIEMDKRYRSRGYGSMVIDELRRKARSVECKDFVFRGVLPSNLRAIELYESLGASPVHASNDRCDFVISPP